MKYLALLIPSLLFFTGCIGDDIIQDTVEAAIRIKNPIDSLTIGNTHQFEATYLNTIGMEEAADIIWSSSDMAILSIDDTGLASGLSDGVATVRAEVAETQEEFQVIVTEEEVVNPSGPATRSGTIRTTSSYTLKGEFSLSEDGNKLLLEIANDYQASSGLPGLYLYLTNNPNSTNGALEIGEVEIFSGAHSYSIEGAELNEYSHLLYYCKPFGVKVGDGELSE